MFPPANPTGEQLTGSTRTAQRPIWDTYAVAGSAAIGGSGQVNLFTSNQVNSGTTTLDVSNMRAQGQLPAGHQFMLRAIGFWIFSTTLADVQGFLKVAAFKFLYSGIAVTEGTLDTNPAGAGVVTGVTLGVPDTRSINYLDQQPIKLEGQTPFQLQLLSSSQPTATTAFFMRAYLFGEYTEPA